MKKTTNYDLLAINLIRKIYLDANGKDHPKKQKPERKVIPEEEFNETLKHLL